MHQLVETRSEEPTSRADSGETQLTAHTREEHSLARALAHVIACLCTARTATRFGWGGRHRLHTHMLIERAASRRSTTRRRWMLSVAPIQIPSPQAIVCAAETVRTSSVPFLTSWLRRCTLQSSTRSKMRLCGSSCVVGNQKPTHGRPSAPSGQVRTLPETPPSPPRRLVVVRAATRRGVEGRTWVSELAAERWVRQCAARRRVVGMRVTSDMHSLPGLQLVAPRNSCDRARTLAEANASWTIVDVAGTGGVMDVSPTLCPADPGPSPSKNRDGLLQSCWEAVVPDAPKPVPDLISLQSTISDPMAPL